MRLYTRLGFVLVREIAIGKGPADRDGNFENGGPGLGIWAMIWEPRSLETQRG